MRKHIKAKVFVAYNFRNLCKSDKSSDLKKKKIILMEDSSFLCHLDVPNLKCVPSLYSSRHFGKPLCCASINSIIHPVILLRSFPYPQTEVQTMNSGIKRGVFHLFNRFNFSLIPVCSVYEAWQLAQSLKISASLKGAV